MTSFGPELPPHLSKRKRSINDEDDKNSSPPTKIQAASPPKERRVLGPAPPPAPMDEKPSESADKLSDDGSSDDDNYGPSLPPAPGSTGACATEAQLCAEEKAIPERPKIAKLQREEWMLVPPKDSDWGSRVDPTKLKNRKFVSSKGGKASTEKSAISGVWTETPEEKRQRLEDEVMGRKDPSTSMQPKKLKKYDAEAEATARRIREYNEKNRSQSLFDQYKKAGPREKEDDPSKRGFDKEKDMGLGGRIGYVQKKEMLKRASDFGSRFERGSYL